MNRCNPCKGYSKCLGFDWYAPNEIRYCPYQIRWVIEHGLGDGSYPNPGKDTGYIDPSIRTKLNRQAYFVLWAEVVAEVNKRIADCEKDGAMLVMEVYGWDIRDISNRFKVGMWEVPKRISRALHYVSGWRRKAQAYSEFCEGFKI